MFKKGDKGRHQAKILKIIPSKPNYARMKDKEVAMLK